AGLPHRIARATSMTGDASTQYDTSTPANRLRALCLEHAADLVSSAERVLENGFANIAYHLAVLALEEIGKAGLIMSRAITAGSRDSEWIDKKLGDHIWKIQWAVWSVGFSGKRIDPKEFEEARRFARS